jgi:hypothetical protein
MGWLWWLFRCGMHDSHVEAARWVRWCDRHSWGLSASREMGARCSLLHPVRRGRLQFGTASPYPFPLCICPSGVARLMAMWKLPVGCAGATGTVGG